MAEFRYEALLLPTLKSIQGLIEAADEVEALELLAQQQNLTRVKLITSPVMSGESRKPAYPPPVQHTSATSPRLATPVENTVSAQAAGGCKLRLEDKISFFRNTGKMLKAGIPIVDILDKQSKRSRRAAFQKILIQIRQDLMGGLTLETSLASHPKSFDTFAVRMIGIGERTGALDHMLERVSQMYQQQLLLREKLISAAMMPLFTLAALSLLGGIIFGQLLPYFVNASESLGASNPVLDAIRLISQTWYLILGAIVAGIAGAGYFFLRTDYGQAIIAELLTILPVFKHPVIQSQNVQFLSALHLTYSAGIPLSEGVELAVESMTNHVIQEKFTTLSDLTAQGMSLAEALPQSETGLAESLQDSLITGEETGMLDSSLATAVAETSADVLILLDRLPEQIKPIATLLLVMLLGLLLAIFYGGLFGMLSSAFH